MLHARPPRPARPPGARSSGAVSARALGLLVEERRLVHEQVGVVGDEPRSSRTGAVSPESTTLAAAPRLAHHLLGRDAVRPSRRAAGGRSRGPASTPSSRGALGVEAPGRGRPRRARSRGRARGGRPRRRDPVAVALELVVRLELDAARAGRSSRPITRRSALEQRARARAGRRRSAAARAARRSNVFSIPGRPSTVVGVEVGDEDVLELGQPDRAQRAGAGCPRRSRTAAGRRRARTSIAGRPRRAVGTEPAVPTKKTSRSMASAEPDEPQSARSCDRARPRRVRDAPSCAPARGGARSG